MDNYVTVVNLMSKMDSVEEFEDPEGLEEPESFELYETRRYIPPGEGEEPQEPNS